jgi:hypothetical protein
MKKLALAIALAIVATVSMAQTPIPTPAPITNSCDLLTILKGLNATNFIARIKSCSGDDIALAISDAQGQSPPDSAALACYLPLQVVANGILKGGLIYKAQLFRDAKRAGLLVNCTNWLNGTIGVL